MICAERRESVCAGLFWWMPASRRYGGRGRRLSSAPSARLARPPGQSVPVASAQTVPQHSCLSLLTNHHPLTRSSSSRPMLFPENDKAVGAYTES